MPSAKTHSHVPRLAGAPHRSYDLHVSLPSQVLEVAPSFFNIRGHFRIGGLIDVKTQASLVRLASGDFVLLDSCDLDEATAAWLQATTNDGERLQAIVHLHPFHTVYAKTVHELFPKTPLFGTTRHQDKKSELPWDELTTESNAFGERFGDELRFSVPQGVDFIPDDENLHFSSVLAFHPASATLHVDDTLNYARLPAPIGWFVKDVVRFHPTLSRVLEAEKGAVAAYRAWAETLIEQCRPIRNLCTAHTHSLIDADVASRVQDAYQRTASTLRKHEAKYG